MKKKILAIISLILVLITLSACGGENYKWTALPGGPSISDKIKGGNDGVAVQKGEYIYFINGVMESHWDDNTFGVPQKGSICRSKLNQDGSIDENEIRVLAPKMFYCPNAGSGIYIPNDNSDKLYYISPSVEKDSYGRFTYYYSDIFRVNLDGTNTKKIGTVDNYTSSKFITIDSKTYFVYLYDVEANESQGIDAVHQAMVLSEDGEKKEIISDYSKALIGDDNYIYYTKLVSEDDTETTDDEDFTRVYRKAIINGVEEEIKYSDGRNIFQDKNSAVKFKYNVGLVEFKGGVLYYTKDIPADGSSKTLYFAYKNGEEYKLNYSETLTKPYFLGFDGSKYRGTIFYSGSSLVLAKANSADAPDIIATLSEEPQYLLLEEAEAESNKSAVLYFMSSGKMYSVEVLDNSGLPKLSNKIDLTKDFKITIDLEKYFPKKIGNHIYFIGINSDKEYYSKYLYRHDITKEPEDDWKPMCILSDADQELKDEAEK